MIQVGEEVLSNKTGRAEGQQDGRDSPNYLRRALKRKEEYRGGRSTAWQNYSDYGLGRGRKGGWGERKVGRFLIADSWTFRWGGEEGERDTRIKGEAGVREEKY